MVLGRVSGSRRDISSLRNWVNYTGSISKDETEFLEKSDIMTTSNFGNDALALVEPRIEDIFVVVSRILSRVGNIPLPLTPMYTTMIVTVHVQLLSTSRFDDQHIFVLPGLAAKILSRMVITSVVLALLVVPVVFLENIDNTASQIGLVATASAVFTLVVSSLTNARAVEVFVSGATYDPWSSLHRFFT